MRVVVTTLPFVLEDHEIEQAALLWADGMSTAMIAKELLCQESDVWNALDQIKAVKIAEAA